MGFYDRNYSNFYEKTRAPTIDLTGYKPIEGFEDAWVNDKGSVIQYSVELKQYVDTKGYLTIQLKDDDGKRKMKRVHILVATAFLEVPEDLKTYRGKLVVDHIDCNKQNPNVTNLHWVTQAENTRLAYQNGMRETVGRKIICLETQKIYNSATAAAAELGVSRAAVTQACIKYSLCKGKNFRYLDEI